MRGGLPVRTCIGCRARVAVSELLRVVLVGDELRPDPGRQLLGRGASVHPDPGCLDLAERRRAFGRAFRVPTAPDPNAVREFVSGSAHRSARARIRAVPTGAADTSADDDGEPSARERYDPNEPAMKSRA